MAANFTDRVGEAWAHYAPNALFLQLTNPLALSLQRTASVSGLKPIGLCELPLTTATKILQQVEPNLGPLTHAHMGLNHQSWLYEFRDRIGRDRTQEVVEIAASNDLLPIAADHVRDEAAIPVDYLKLIYAPSVEVAKQRLRGRPRGDELAEWASALSRAYLSSSDFKPKEIDQLLNSRRMDWYDKMIGPVIVAAATNSPIDTVMSITDYHPDVALELPCRFENMRATAKTTPPLPKGPAELLNKLILYEKSALALKSRPAIDDLAEVIAKHPLVSREETAIQLAQTLYARMSNWSHGSNEDGLQ